MQLKIKKNNCFNLKKTLKNSVTTLPKLLNTLKIVLLHELDFLQQYSPQPQPSGLIK